MLPHVAPRDQLDRLADSVDGLASEVKDARDHVTAEMRGLDQVVCELAGRLQWVCNNVLGDQWKVISMPAEPLAPDFAERLKRMKIGERITMTAGEFEHAMNPINLACRSCECEPPLSLEQALRDGWTELMEDKTEQWNYLGLCPACREQEPAETETGAGQPVECHACKTKGPASPAAALKAGWVVLSYNVAAGYVGMCPGCEAKRVEAEVAKTQRQTQDAVYCCASPHLEWNGDPEAPGIACTNCRHVVADAGSLVFFEDLEDREPPPKGDPQKSLF